MNPAVPAAAIRLALVLAFVSLAGQPAGAAQPRLAAAAARPVSLAVTPDDVRVLATSAILAGDWARALREVERAIVTDREAGPGKGLYTLRGHILDGLGEPRDAADAFAQAMALGPKSLEPYARYRLALAQFRMRHPEVAAGLLATLLGHRPPEDLVAPAVRLLRAALAGGGDCRVTPAGLGKSFDKSDRRRLEFARAACVERQGDPATAAQTYRQLLDQDLDDDVALDAAQAWALQDPNPPRHTAELLGLAFHKHREFEIAARYLDPLTAAGTASFDVRYATLRGEFWRGRYQLAAQGYAALLPTLPEQTRRALVAYQQGRSLELVGDPEGASAAYRQSYDADPKGEDAPAALLSALRVDWQRGHEKEALRTLGQLRTRSAWRSATHRAALFLASGDLARGRTNRAAAWIEVARLAAGPEDEIAYWQGRLAEHSGAAQSAVLAYGRAIRAAPWSPFATAAGRRLEGPALAAAAKSAAARLQATGSLNDLLSAWALLDRGGAKPPAQEATAAAVSRRLLAVLASDAPAQRFLAAAPVPVEAWPVWGIAAPTPQEELLRLAGWGEGSEALPRHFVTTDPSLALTGAELATRGGEPRRGLTLAQNAIEKMPASIPLPLVSRALLLQIYPHPYRALVEREATRHRVDPHLLTAILREESRFDRYAMSGAAARGLAQFVLPTARELGRRLGLGVLTPADLEIPEISIGLAAAYLAELIARTGAAERAVAAYNAGEAQVALWKSTCGTDEPEEFLSKVSFKETRAYLQRVLTSRNAYAEIYR